MPKVTVNGLEVEVPSNSTVFQACEAANIEIPHFCYHKRLKIAGNCRMCLVEVEKSPKPVASCAMPVADGMVIHTNTEKVRKAREGVMELLLINHPLDCPICDQGGECDLQDQAFKYGRGLSRYVEEKRAVEDKYMGPLIKTHMNRCIHCTRCIRFANDIAGVQEVGAIYRGEHMEITTLELAAKSELSGNMIDVCPVGALTAKPYAYTGRKWEMEKTSGIDIHDAVGSNIEMHTRNGHLMRILPKLNESINEEWITDKVRFAFDGLKYQRLDRPYVKINRKLQETSFDNAISAIVKKLKSANPSRIGVIAGNIVDCETMFAMKSLMNAIGVHNLDANQQGLNIDISSRGNYLFNTTISKIREADFCLLIGANPKINAPILNSVIGQQVRSGKMHVFGIGCFHDQTYAIQDLGQESSILLEILAGKHQICDQLSAAKKPILILGDAVLTRQDSIQIQAAAHEIAKKYNFYQEDWNGFNILHNHASTVGAIDIGFWADENSKNTTQMLEDASEGKMDLIYLLNADEIDISKLKNTFVIYQGHHGDKAAEIADIIIPVPAYPEKNSSYINLEGRLQISEASVKKLGLAQEDFIVINKIAKSMDIDLPWDTVDELRLRMLSSIENMSNIETVGNNEVNVKTFDKYNFDTDSIHNITPNFYMTDSICRASPTMLKCVKEKLGHRDANNCKEDVVDVECANENRECSSDSVKEVVA